MALNYVTITGTFDDGTGAPQSGSATFTPSTSVYAAGVPLVSTANPIRASINNGVLQGPSGGSLTLLATDNTGLTFSGQTGFFYWSVVVLLPGMSSSFSFFLPHIPSSVDLFALANTAASSGLPLTTLGDTVYENATPAPARLPGNTSTTKNFLTQTGTGSTSAAPAWGTIAPGDVPQLTNYAPTGLTGATSGASRYVGGTVVGPPTAGTFADGDFVIDQLGVEWVCRIAGTPGTWCVAGDLPWQFRPESYGALGNSKVVADGAITSGQATLTTPGIAAPSTPSVSNATSGGTVLTGTYQIRVTYVNPYGETVASGTASTTTTTNASTITVTTPAYLGNATGFYAYITQPGGSTFTRQQAAGFPTVIGFNFVLTAPPTSGGANPPASNTTPSNPFVAGDVGKVVAITGAGPVVGGNNGTYTGTINTFNNAGSVTLSANASATVSAAFVTFGTDDTAAIQATINAAAAYGSTPPHNFYAEVLFQAHIYMIAGALVQGGNTKGNAQLTLPVVPIGGNPPLMLALTGTRNGGGVGMFAANGDNPAPDTLGTVLFSTLQGQSFSATLGGPSVIGGPTSQQGFTGGFTNLWNDLVVAVDGLTIMCPVFPTVTAIDLRTCIRAEIKWLRSLAYAPETSLTSWNSTLAGGIGLGMPQTGNNAHCYIGSFACAGFTYGASLGEHTAFQEISAILCAYGLFITGGGGHGIAGVVANLEANGTHIQSSGQASTLDIVSLQTEALQAGWGTGFYFDDSGNNLFGRLGWGSSVALSGATFNGATNLELISGNQTTRGFQTPPSVPATTVALRNPFWRHANVFLTSGGAAVTAIAVNGTATGLTLGTSGTVMVRVPSGATITLTYASTAPTWAWELD